MKTSRANTRCCSAAFSLAAVLLFSFALAGCAGRGDYAAKLSKMLDRRVSFSDTYTLVSGGKVFDSDSSLSSFRGPCVLFFLDSQVCQSCITKYSGRWDEFVRDSIGFGVKPLFVASPLKDYSAMVCETVVYDSLRFYIDVSDQFLKMNDFIPDEQAFHSMLLDEEGRVLAIGNPVGNSSMVDFFRERLDSSQQ